MCLLKILWTIIPKKESCEISMLPYELRCEKLPFSSTLNFYGSSEWEDLATTKRRCEEPSTDTQCWIWSVTGLRNFCWQDNQYMQLTSSEKPGNWNCPASPVLASTLQPPVHSAESAPFWKCSFRPFHLKFWEPLWSMEKENSSLKAVNPFKLSPKKSHHTTITKQLI